MGLVDGHGEPSFSCVKMEVLDVGERGNQTPLVVRCLGQRGGGCDVVAAVEHATEERREVKLTDRKALVVGCSKLGVCALSFCEAYRKGMKPGLKGASRGAVVAALAPPPADGQAVHLGPAQGGRVARA